MRLDLSSSLLKFKMTFKSIVFVFSILSINEITGRSLPNFINPCKRNDPKINECLKKTLENFRPYISKGIPEMHILPLDPIKIPAVTLNQGSGSVNFVALFTDLIGYGANSYQVQKAKVNFKNNTFEIDINLPLLKIKSNYEVNGKVLLLPIQGNGTFVGNFTDARANLKFDFKIVEKKNKKDFIEVNLRKISLTLGAAKLHFSDLFNGNKELSEQTNQFINENWKELLQEMRPLLEDTIGVIAMGIFKPVVETYSIDDLFPV